MEPFDRSLNPVLAQGMMAYCCGDNLDLKMYTVD